MAHFVSQYKQMFVNRFYKVNTPRVEVNRETNWRSKIQYTGSKNNVCMVGEKV
jgi:hypothetical protein